MDLSNIPVSKSIEKGLEKPFSTAGKVINALLLAVFSPILKYEVKKEAEIEAYKQTIINEISKIPEEKLVEPPLNIVGPALEASKYYIDSDEIKSMFAKLIASSMNIDSKDFTHPSFIEIIKQLSPLDAQNLNIFFNHRKLPIVEYFFANGQGGRALYKTNVFLDNSSCNDIDLISTSITNLNRLGIIKTDYNSYFNDNRWYKAFEEHPLYLKYEKMFSDPEFKNQCVFINEYFPDINFLDYNKIAIAKGFASLTPFGECFTRVCL